MSRLSPVDAVSALLSVDVTHPHVVVEDGIRSPMSWAPESRLPGCQDAHEGDDDVDLGEDEDDEEFDEDEDDDDDESDVK